MVRKFDTVGPIEPDTGRFKGVPEPGVIEEIEAAGQVAFVNSDVLPTTGIVEASEWEALGFIFGAVLADDPLFQRVMLPEGWTRKGSSHSMWSYLYDAAGFRRVAIFYKAVSYDRSAHMALLSPPLTDAQDETLAAVYASLGKIERGKPWWGDHERKAREDGAIIATWKLREVNRWPTPETLHATRVVVIDPDGTISSDRTVDA